MNSLELGVDLWNLRIADLLHQEDGIKSANF